MLTFSVRSWFYKLNYIEVHLPCTVEFQHKIFSYASAGNSPTYLIHTNQNSLLSEEEGVRNAIFVPSVVVFPYFK